MGSKTVNQTGQSIIEVIVSLGLVLVIVTAITLTVLNGLENSQFSKNQSQATELAKEAVEAMKVMKERNCLINMGYFNATSPSYFWRGTLNQLIWDTNFLGSTKYFSLTLNTSTCLLTELTNGSYDTLSAPYFSIFKRKITISDLVPYDNKAKKVFVEVNWQDNNGVHSAKNETILTRQD